MKYAGIITNDFSAAPGTCVSFFTQGCPHHCPGCHNPETWDFDGGKEFTSDTIDSIIKAISANGINRSFCIMGGEPLCQENLFLTNLVIKTVKAHYPNILIYIWTGYYYEDLIKSENKLLKSILDSSNFLIDGPFKIDERDITLPMRGSKNQRILNLKEIKNKI